MKKLLFILLFAPILFIACKDETEGHQTEQPTFTLVGKKYAGADPITNIIYGDCVDVYRFINDTVVEISTRKNNATGVIQSIEEKPYLFIYPNNLNINNSIYELVDEQTIRKDYGVYGIAEFVLIN